MKWLSKTYIWVIMAFLYAPIGVLIFFSFNQSKSRSNFTGFTLDAARMALAKPDCMVQHPLPAHRGEEIAPDVLEAHADEIFDEAENRLHAQKAIMAICMG